MRRFFIAICTIGTLFVLANQTRAQGPPVRQFNESDQSFSRRSQFSIVENAERFGPTAPVAPRPRIAPLWRDWGPKARAASRPRPSQPRLPALQLLSENEQFAPKLKIHYKLVRVGRSTGAQLTRVPTPGSPALRIWVNGTPVYLEPNDVIYKLDSLPIREAADVERHYGRTEVSFLDHRSRRALTGVMMLP